MSSRLQFAVVSGHATAQWRAWPPHGVLRAPPRLPQVIWVLLPVKLQVERVAPLLRGQPQTSDVEIFCFTTSARRGTHTFPGTGFPS